MRRLTPLFFAAIALAFTSGLAGCDNARTDQSYRRPPSEQAMVQSGYSSQQSESLGVSVGGSGGAGGDPGQIQSGGPITYGVPQSGGELRVAPRDQLPPKR